MATSNFPRVTRTYACATGWHHNCRRASTCPCGCHVLRETRDDYKPLKRQRQRALIERNELHALINARIDAWELFRILACRTRRG